MACLFLATGRAEAAVCEAPAGSACYYASPGGSGDCSFATPCAVAAGLLRLGAGDYLYLLDGTYSDIQSQNGFDAIVDMSKYFAFRTPGTESLPIVVKAYPGHTPVIRGDGQHWCILVDNQSHVTIEGLVVEQCWEAGVRIGYDAATSDIAVKGCDFSGVTCDDNHGGVYVGGAQRVTIEQCRFHDNHYSRGTITNDGMGC